MAAGRVPKRPPPPEAFPVVRVSVEIVQVDAVVTDDKGRQVTDLTPADFVVKEGGQERDGIRFNYAGMAGPTPRSTTRSTCRSRSRDRTSSASRCRTPPPSGWARRARWYAFQILNARRDPATKRPRLTARARLWKGRQVLYEGPETPLAIDSPDLTRIAAGGRLDLSSRLPAGDYVLEVKVVDAVAGRNGVATQWVDLEAVAR